MPACPCRQLSPGMYAIADACELHSDRRGASHFWCVCYIGPGLHCLACTENAARGQAASGLAQRPQPSTPKAEVGQFARVAAGRRRA